MAEPTGSRAPVVGSAPVADGVGEVAPAHRVSVVVPVYQGERTLEALVEEILPYTTRTATRDGNVFVVDEILLVWDHGPDRSDVVIRRLEAEHDLVRGVWLSRNYGQHPATLAGMASAGGDWIATIDEDGQHDPASIAVLLDAAMAERAEVVYAKPTNEAPHGAFRNTSSKAAKTFLNRFAGTRGAENYHSLRLVLGTIGRSVAAYAGSGVYLDVALGWVSGRIVTAPVELRGEGDRVSGYSTRRLFAHFLRMVLTTGTRGLRLVGALGVLFAAVGVVVAIFVIVARLLGGVTIEGWASTIVVLLLGVGAILFSLGVIAEYIGVAVNMALGKPPYLITSDPEDGPLGRGRPRR